MHHRAPPSDTHHWTPAESPWQRIHIDFAGPMDNLMFLIVVDAFSKWPEVFPMRSTTTQFTVTILHTLFARMGLPQIIVSDNGPQFSSTELHEHQWYTAYHHCFIPLSEQWAGRTLDAIIQTIIQRECQERNTSRR